MLVSEAAGRGEVVLQWGDKVGTHGADVISVNPKTGEVILYDAKTYSTEKNVQPSTTFRPGSESLLEAREKAEIAIRNSNLPPDVKKNAIENISEGHFTTITTAQGNAKSSPLPVKFCGNQVCS